MLDISSGHFDIYIDEDQVSQEVTLDGLYVIPTTISKEQAECDDVVPHYKDLSKVVSAFRCLKNDDIQIRPVYHWTENRIYAHFL